MIAAVIFVVTAIVLPIVLTELTAWGPRVAVRIVHRAARQLTPPHSDRYAQEWAAELDSVPGQLSKVLKALSIFCGMRRLRQSLPTPIDHLEVATSAAQAVYDVVVVVNGQRYTLQTKHRTGAVTVADVLAVADASRFTSANASLVLVRDDNLVHVAPEETISGENLRFLVVPELLQGPDVEGEDHEGT